MADCKYTALQNDPGLNTENYSVDADRVGEPQVGGFDGKRRTKNGIDLDGGFWV